MSLSQLLPFSGALLALFVAAFSLIRSQRKLADWGLALGMVVLAAEAVFIGLSAGSQDLAAIVRWQSGRLLSAALLPGTWLLFSLNFARGDAPRAMRRWLPTVVAAFLIPLGLLIPALRNLNEQVSFPEETNYWVLLLDPPGMAIHLCLLLGSIIVLTNLERTLRAAVGTIRWRIKFAVFGVGVIFVVRLYTSSQALLFQSVEPYSDALKAVSLLLGGLLILRYLGRPGSGRVTLDVYPSRSVLQGSLTVFLAGIYLLVVGALAKIVSALGGDETFALKALLILVALVSLAVVLQSDRARFLLGQFVSRHFQRPSYDYRNMWRQFSRETASRVEQADLAQALVRLVAEMFRVLSVNLWLIDEQRESFTRIASTAETGTDSVNPISQAIPASDLIAHFERHPDPVDFERESEPWAQSLRDAHPRAFPHGGDRVCLPLVGRKELIGILTIGDRVGGTPFVIQDFDMMKCVADHAAASVLNLQLSRRLVQAKEFEAFQTMATFFVHDLKNAASTLNLMLKNLPVHFDDPAFRQDALRGMDKTVGHINRVISRLSQLRQGLHLERSVTDLNDVLRRAVAGLDSASDKELEVRLSPLPPCAVDPEQVSKVVVNLVLNAREATPPGGRIIVSSEQQENWAVISVADNGCGIHPDFVQQSLFRPFRTTKKDGLGIGMFHCKMIVEAHGGKIRVESEVGQGTTFEVLLPLEVESARQEGDRRR